MDSDFCWSQYVSRIWAIVDKDSRFALAFGMVGKVFTAFPIGRLSSAALATDHVHDAIGPSFYREIDKKWPWLGDALSLWRLAILCLLGTTSDDRLYRTAWYPRAVVVDEDDRELELLILRTYCSWLMHMYEYSVSRYVWHNQLQP